ncbi:hypothetical protein [Streptomyces bugieae]|uniref:Transposase Helix-turn-helix domain-containing protein n=1 Tax=Streptomyces bugieae TaxID=3098223 RepID=A0ABU7NWU5_9ACTN|nr:hypothetical protein [Streptomyces sp. DSM 41528]
MTTKEWARAALSHLAFAGISLAHLGGLIEELAGPWTARCESALHERRGGQHKQQPGSGPKHDLVFTDPVLITLIHLRHQLPHAALARLYGLERSTIATGAAGNREPRRPRAPTGSSRTAGTTPTSVAAAACTTASVPPSPARKRRLCAPRWPAGWSRRA